MKTITLIQNEYTTVRLKEFGGHQQIEVVDGAYLQGLLDDGYQVVERQKGKHRTKIVLQKGGGDGPPLTGLTSV